MMAAAEMYIPSVIACGTHHAFHDRALADPMRRIPPDFRLAELWSRIDHDAGPRVRSTDFPGCIE